MKQFLCADSVEGDFGYQKKNKKKHFQVQYVWFLSLVLFMKIENKNRPLCCQS